MFHLSWTKTVAENPCQPTVLVSLAYGGLTLFTQTNFWWFRRIPDSLVTSHIQAWWLWWPQDFLESAAKMKCHGYVHHVFLKNSIVSFSELPNKYELYLNESCLIYNKKNYKPELEVGTLSIFRKFSVFLNLNDWGVFCVRPSVVPPRTGSGQRGCWPESRLYLSAYL